MAVTKNTPYEFNRNTSGKAESVPHAVEVTVMPQSKKDVRKQQQRKDAAAGIDRTQKKVGYTLIIQDDNVFATCQKCQASLRVTKRNVELKTHWEAKHAGTPFNDCWPGQKYEGQA